MFSLAISCKKNRQRGAGPELRHSRDGTFHGVKQAVSTNNRGTIVTDGGEGGILSLKQQ